MLCIRKRDLRGPLVGLIGLIKNVQYTLSQMIPFWVDSREELARQVKWFSHSGSLEPAYLLLRL